MCINHPTNISNGITIATIIVPSYMCALTSLIASANISTFPISEISTTFTLHNHSPPKVMRARICTLHNAIVNNSSLSVLSMRLMSKRLPIPPPQHLCFKCISMLAFSPVYDVFTRRFTIHTYSGKHSVL